MTRKTLAMSISLVIYLQIEINVELNHYLKALNSKAITCCIKLCFYVSFSKFYNHSSRKFFQKLVQINKKLTSFNREFNFQFP